MKYVQINSVPYGSTGSVMKRIHDERVATGDESWMMWGRGREAENDWEFNFGTKLGWYFDVAQTRLDDRAGFHSKRATRRLLKKLDAIVPDVVHLHNLHGYYVNVEMLFAWLTVHHCKVKWTLHDCWAFTGHCSYFTYAECDRWVNGCHDCPQKSEYPRSVLLDSSEYNYRKKKQIFNMLPTDRVQIIVPSRWLADLVAFSFLSQYPVTVKHNEIDRSVFKPTPSDFRKRYGLEDKFVVLGVASPWNKRKGLDDFLYLADVLDDHYAIVLVGLTAAQIKRMPERILALERIDQPESLARVYSSANLFVHPGVEETYGLTVAEALSCGVSVAVRAGSACEETAKSGEHFAFERKSLVSTIFEAKALCDLRAGE